MAKSTAVLQESDEKHEEQDLIIILLGLDGYPKQFCNKRRLP
jgi:hypothetical protein